MKLRFPRLGGGPQQGLNDAGVENFVGAIDRYLVRECGQNTGDAARQGVATTRLEFDRLTMPPSQLPAFADLAITLQACRTKWDGDTKSRAFFDEALATARQPPIHILKISDYGTTGLSGSDIDERGRWFALVKSQGVSNKESTAGGSFGIGKSSPFAASRFRTVYYGTMTEEGQVAFQGVSRLVTHKGTDGLFTQGVGFIGDLSEDPAQGAEPVFTAIREADRIPPQFRRTEPGTDIWVVGYRSGAEWQSELLRAILRDFWPAIHFGRIEFRVGQQSVDRNNLARLIDQHAGEEDFDVHHYYRVVNNAPITRRLRTVGECELYLSTSRTELPKRICMARQSGMRIYDYPPRACRVPFVGLFLCKDHEGNTLLRRLEPPRHDEWDPKRVDGPEGKNALNEIKGWIREEVKKLNPLFSSDSFNEEELARYLPDSMPEDESPLPTDGSNRSPEEELTPRPRALVPRLPVRATPLPLAAGDSEEGGVGTEGEAGVPPHAGGSSGEGRHTNTGGQGRSEPHKLRTRAFATGPAMYTLVVRSDTSFTGALVVKSVGEDGATDPVQIQTAVSLGDQQPLAVSGDRIRGISLSPGVPLTLSIGLAHAARRALAIVGAP